MTTAERLFQEALECDKNENYEEAFTLYLAAAELEYVPAYANVGYAYLKGEGTEKDYNKAVEFFQKGMAAGNATAVVNLGVCYAYGYGVPQDEQKALELYKQAADAGHELGKKNYEKLLKKLGGTSSKPVHAEDLVIEVEVNLTGPTNGTTRHVINVPQMGRDYTIDFPNDIKVGERMRVQGKGPVGTDGIPADVVFKVVKVNYKANTGNIKLEDLFGNREEKNTNPNPNKPISVDTGVGGLGFSNRNSPVTSTPKSTGSKFVKKLKRRVYGNYIFCYICAAICAMLLLLPARFPWLFSADANPAMTAVLSLLLVATLYPGLGGILATPGLIKRVKHMKRLEQRGLLELAAREVFTGKTEAFGDKALLSEHFLFRKQRRGLIIPCEDILWFYTGKISRYCDFKIGTRYNGVMTFSGVSRYVKNFDGVVNEMAQRLHRRNKDLMINNTTENKMRYVALTANNKK